MKYSILALVFMTVNCLCPMHLLGQGNTGDNMQEVKNVLNELKLIDDMAYDYSIGMSYPDDTKEEMHGTSFFDKKSGISFSETEYFTVIYSHDWFYRADHVSKIVTIVDFHEADNKEMKKGIENDIFNSGMLTHFLDSVVYKHALIESFKSDKDTIKALLTFSKGVDVRKISFVYNRNLKLFVEYQMEMFFPTEQVKKKLVGIKENVSCKNFNRGGTNSKYRLDNYFVKSKKGVVTLKKYNGYKLNPDS